MLEASAASLELIPVGGGIVAGEGVREMVIVGGTLFTLGIRFAAPVIAVVLISNLEIGILARDAPQLNILIIAFPVPIRVEVFTIDFIIHMIENYFVVRTSAYN